MCAWRLAWSVNLVVQPSCWHWTSCSNRLKQMVSCWNLSRPWSIQCSNFKVCYIHVNLSDKKYSTSCTCTGKDVKQKSGFFHRYDNSGCVHRESKNPNIKPILWLVWFLTGSTMCATIIKWNHIYNLIQLSRFWRQNMVRKTWRCEPCCRRDGREAQKGAFYPFLSWDLIWLQQNVVPHQEIASVPP